MKSNRLRLFLAIALVTAIPVFGPAASMEQSAAPAADRKAVNVDDVIAWKTVSTTAVSNNGDWFAYRVAPQEGDAELTVRNIASGKETKFPLGEVGAPAGPGGGGGGAVVAAGGATLQFSDDSKWIAFNTSPLRAEAQRLRRQRRPVQTGVTVVNLASGDKREYSSVRRFAFSGDAATHIALHRAPAPPVGGAPAAAAAPGGGRAGGPGGGAAADSRPKGTDLIIRELTSGAELNVGNVSEFAFTRDGKFLASVIDATDKVGNGVQLRNMMTGTVVSLDTDNANYERLSWTRKGDGLTVLKGKEDRAFIDKMYSIVGFTGFGSGDSKKAVFDPSKDKTFPEGFAISGNRAATWNEKMDAFVFGIREPRKKDTPADPQGTTPPAEGTDAPAPPATPAPNADADEKVDLVLWHWKDSRLQSQQEVQETADRNFSYLSIYHVGPQKFVRLADDDVRSVSMAPKDKFAIGFDDREYELMGNMDGRRYRDVHVINPSTGERKLALKRARWYNGPSPDGESFLYYEDGQFFVHSMATGQAKNITMGVPASFIDTEDDHNVVKPPTSPLGWTKGSKAVLISDNWDIWQVPVDGGAAVNLTVNGRKDQIRYQRRFPLETLDDRDDGVDLSKPQFFAVYGEWTKKGGIARLDPGKAGLTNVLWGDASFSRLMKAEKADVVVYTKETALEPADYYATDFKFGEPRRLTDMRPQVAAFNWTPGVQLVNYTCDKGDKLQAALYLPANYEKGKSYPTLVNFYERMSQGANTFANPSANGFNRSVYTSQGYAVLIPDIVYKVNDPGMSAVWCMVPAVKAAIATGVVDAKKVGITGHSWGGYQTSFLVTQTDIFAAAVAGAPLTNMISMYSLVYKNSGGGNMAIFESSQGRFKGGYWDNWDAYYRNSPVFFAKNVKTPLMILHNDKDGAVDFTQGVEYYNTLRRMGKPVIMLEYVGENHGLARRPNQRDYTVRMKEYFDHYLKGEPAPEWMLKGVSRLKMEEHLKDRKKKAEPPAKKITIEGGGKAVEK